MRFGRLLRRLRGGAEPAVEESSPSKEDAKVYSGIASDWLLDNSAVSGTFRINSDLADAISNQHHYSAISPDNYVVQRLEAIETGLTTLQSLTARRDQTMREYLDQAQENARKLSAIMGIAVVSAFMLGLGLVILLIDVVH